MISFVFSSTNMTPQVNIFNRQFVTTLWDIQMGIEAIIDTKVAVRDIIQAILAVRQAGRNNTNKRSQAIPANVSEEIFYNRIINYNNLRYMYMRYMCINY